MHQSAGSGSRAQKINNQIEHLRVQNRWSFKVLASRRCAGENEDSGTDDRADAKSRQRPRPERFFQPVSRFVGFGDQLVNGFATK